MGTSPRPFQQDRIKYGNSHDEFKKPRAGARNNISKRKHLSDRVKLWTTFYRRNLHRFVEHYLEIKLYPFQKIMIYLMGISTTFISIASRGTSKSYLTSLYACCVSILYPNNITIIAASTRGQGGLLVKEKIEKELITASPNLAREIKKITSGQNETSVTFHNGSRIIVVVSSDSSRGHRANLLIMEEWRLLDREVVEQILKPFLISRQTPYIKDEKYTHLAEEPKQIYISSAYYKSYNEGYMWKEILISARNMLKGFEKDDFSYIVTSFDYLLSVYHGLKTKKTMEDAEASTDEISFLMEYKNIMYDENQSSYFKLNMFRPRQTIKKAFQPYNHLFHQNMGKKKYKSNINKQDGEIRIVSVDIAMREGKDNDNTIMTCMRFIPTKEGYKRQIVYMESHNGENSIKQAIRIRQLFADFEADYIVLDLQQSGITIYDMLGTILRDDERDIEYEALTVMNTLRRYTDLAENKIDELERRTITNNAKGVIYPISASAELNSQIAVDFRDKLNRGMVEFLIETDKAEDYLIESNEHFKSAFEKSDSHEKAIILNPYNQINEFINECVNLEYSVVGGKIKIDEKKGRKDRYTSVSYGNYFATRLEVDLLMDTSSEEDFDVWASILGF